jgi:hypothetical protein
MAQSPPSAEELLTLAAITYRGFAKITATPTELERAMTALLNRLDPVRGAWELIWGPASFRAGLNAFDDAAMFVVRRRTDHSQIVIAVRGTNPISLFDWFFGDLVVAEQVPWPYGNPAATPGAKISFSTALGLSILQHLRWPGGGSKAEPRLHDPAADAAPSGLTERTRTALRGVRDKLTESIRRADEVLANNRFHLPADWLDKVVARRSSQRNAIEPDVFDRVVRELADTRLDPLRLLLGGTRVQQAFKSGQTLHGFLKDLVKGKVDISVTGHSKGGALCTALGVWLADTQGTDHVSPADQWDPQRQATVHVCGFAGPTPGNGAFARHVESVLRTTTPGAAPQSRCLRLVNYFDIVPRAFATADLRTISTLYGSAKAERQALERLAEHMVRDLDRLDYTHAGSLRTLDAAPLDTSVFGKHVVHHHLDGYFQALGLSARTTTFFDPF